MDPASVDQAEAMLKALESMRTNLDKFDEIDFEEIVIDGHRYNINDTLQSWMKSIFKRQKTGIKRRKRKRKDSNQRK